MVALAQPPDVLTLLRALAAFAAFFFLPGYLALRQRIAPHEQLLLSVLLSVAIVAIVGVALAFTAGMNFATLSISLSALIAVEYALWKKR